MGGNDNKAMFSQVNIITHPQERYECVSSVLPVSSVESSGKEGNIPKPLSIPFSKYLSILSSKCQDKGEDISNCLSVVRGNLLVKEAVPLSQLSVRKDSLTGDSKGGCEQTGSVSQLRPAENLSEVALKLDETQEKIVAVHQIMFH